MSKVAHGVSPQQVVGTIEFDGYFKIGRGFKFKVYRGGNQTREGLKKREAVRFREQY